MYYIDKEKKMATTKIENEISKVSESPVQKFGNTTLDNSTPTSIKSMMSRLSRFSIFSSNSSSKSQLLCRICHDDNGAELISPCRCSGTMSMIHKQCLEKWLSHANYCHCELCGFQYNVVKSSQGVSRWLCNDKSSHHARNFGADLVCFCILTPLALVSSYLCALSAYFYLIPENSKPKGVLEATGLLFLSVFLILCYALWLSLTLRYHCVNYMEWEKKNQDIRLASNANKV